MALISKEILFGQTSTSQGSVEIHGSIHIPVSTKTKNEIDSAWRALSNSTSMATISDYFYLWGISGGGFPYYFPGSYTGGGSISSNTDWMYHNSIQPKAEMVNGVKVDSFIRYTDANGSGLSLSSAGIELYIDGVQKAFISSQINSLGQLTYGGSSTPAIYTRGIAITLDGYVCYYSCGINKNNSQLAWFSATQSNNIISWIRGLPAYSNDPYRPGGYSGTGGGNGTFDDTSVAVPIPQLPTISSADTGLITLYNPSLSQLRDLADYLWSPLFDIDTLKKLFAEPMDAILGLSIVPVQVQSTNSRELYVGNRGTGIIMGVADSQWIEVDCGSLTVNERWGCYLDYSPYTKADLYLPHIGSRPISADDIMGKTIHIVYHVDILSGTCVAYVEVNGTVLYTFAGQCSCSIPITGNNWTDAIRNALMMAASIGTIVATGGQGAPLTKASESVPSGLAQAGAWANRASSIAASNVVDVLKPNIERSGAVGGTAGILGIQKPYLVLTRPSQAIPEAQNEFMGYPSFVTRKLGSLSGYTEVSAIHLENIPATEVELTEIESLLKAGVIF